MSRNNPDDSDSAFVRRFTEDPQSISDEEAARRYRQVAAQLPPDDYQQAAEAALARLSPQERVALGRQLLTEARAAGGTDFPDANGDGIDDRLQDPRYLAGVTARAQQQGVLNRLLGGLGLAPAAPGPAGYPPPASYPPSGAPGGLLGGNLGKIALGGIAAAGLARMLGGGYGGGGFFGGGGGGHHGGGGFFGGGHHGGGHH